jgi:hypothetical protein
MKGEVLIWGNDIQSVNALQFSQTAPCPPDVRAGDRGTLDFGIGPARQT